MAEWSNAPDSKSGIRLYRIEGSNPSPSAKTPFKSSTYRTPQATYNSSYNSFAEKIENELNVRFTQLVSVFSSRGSADIIPATVSTKRFYTDKTAVTPAQGYISSPYGIRSNPFNSKEKEFHTGIDIANEIGTDIISASNGIVVKVVSLDKYYGNYIDIEDNGYTFRYAHLNEILVKENDEIKKGNIIAKMGSTGMSTGPHLHFEIIKDNIRINPESVIKF